MSAREEWMSSDENVWTVEVYEPLWGPWQGWLVWSAWVDRATAEAEARAARAEGYSVRIERSA